MDNLFVVALGTKCFNDTTFFTGPLQYWFKAQLHATDRTELYGLSKRVFCITQQVRTKYDVSCQVPTADTNASAPSNSHSLPG